jgi:ABC-type Fe3+ transport system permease subunit
VYQPQPGYAAQPAEPGKTLGIVGLILSIASYVVIPFLGAIAGIIVSAIARSQSKKAGIEKNTPALVGLILGIVSLALSIIVTIIIVIVAVSVGAAFVQACNELGPGEHIVDGVRYACGG